MIYLSCKIFGKVCFSLQGLATQSFNLTDGLNKSSNSWISANKDCKKECTFNLGYPFQDPLKKFYKINLNQFTAMH